MPRQAALAIEVAQDFAHRRSRQAADDGDLTFIRQSVAGAQNAFGESRSQKAQQIGPAFRSSKKADIGLGRIVGSALGSSDRIFHTNQSISLIFFRTLRTGRINW